MFSFKIGKGKELRWGFAYLEADYSDPNCMIKVFCPAESIAGKIILRNDQRRSKTNLGVMKCWGIVLFSSRKGWGQKTLCHITGSVLKSYLEVRQQEVIAVRMRRARGVGGQEPRQGRVRASVTGQ